MGGVNPGLRAYRRIEVSTADRGRLLLGMFEGALAFLKQAEAYRERDDVERFSHFLRRAQDVITELMTTLDRERGGEIAAALDRLYEFMVFRLSEANLATSAAFVREVVRCLTPIYEAYREIILHPTPELAGLLRDVGGRASVPR